MLQRVKRKGSLDMKTRDNVEVNVGDTVWVKGSIGFHKTTVAPVVPVTTYYLFGLIPVHHSFSSKKKAEEFYKNNNAD